MRAVLLAVVGFLATVVALCRMYTGFHYLSDTVAGVLVGGLWLTIVYRTVLRPGETVALPQHELGAPIRPYEPTGSTT